jgi:hypothetical protein
MITKNNWLTSNIAERQNNPCADFTVKLNPYPFEVLNFTDAAELAALDIANNYSNLYVALSGGLDSDYIVRLFHRLGIKFVTIIVCCGNEIENQYAYETCKELGINPVVIHMSENTFKEYYYEYIFKKLNGVGWNSTQVIAAANYAKERNGVLLTGNHFLGDGNELVSEMHYANSNEWDYYLDYIVDVPNIDLFLYTPQLACSMLPKKIESVEWNYYRHRLYNIKYREKMKAKYSDDVIKFYKSIQGSVLIRPKSMHYWTKNEFDQIFKNYVQ